MKLKELIFEKCPLGQVYGGIQSGGGYSHYTEYEIGSQRMAEALHCILGSLFKMKSNKNSPEEGHIREEFGIIDKVLNEYKKPLYLGRLFKNYAKESIKSITKASNSLIQKIPKLKKGLDVSPKIKKVAEATYDMLYQLASSNLNSIDKDKVINNVFSSSKLAENKLRLGNTIDNLFGEK